MPLKSGYSMKTIKANVVILTREGRAPAQAWAIAYDEARRAYKARFPQGFLPPWLTPGGGYRGNPAGRPKKADSLTNAERQRRYRAQHTKVKTGGTITATIERLAKEFDLPIQAIVRELLRFALCNKNWHLDGFPGALRPNRDEIESPGTLDDNDDERAANPVPASSSVQIREASDLYHDFSGHKAREIGTVDKPIIPDILIAIGYMDGIMYSTVRDGKNEKYLHKFKNSSRPLFCVPSDGSAIFAIGGSYDFTERGIVDR